MNDTQQYIVYLIILFFAFLTSLRSFKKQDNALKFLSVLLGFTFISECSALYAAFAFHNNLVIYHFFNPIQLFLIALYYNEVLPSLKRKKVGLYVGLAGIIIAATNTIFIQHLDTLNSNYLLIEGLCVISFSLHFFLCMLKDDTINIYSYSHFWISVTLLFFWCVTYTNWAMYNALGDSTFYAIPFVGTLLWIVNIITYLSLSLIIIVFSKKPHYEIQ